MPGAIPLKLRLMFDPSPPMLGPGFMAMAISRLCSASFSDGLCRPMKESMFSPGCGLSQLSGVEYRPSRGGTSRGGTVSIPARWSARLMDEKPSSSDSALSSALSSTKSSRFIAGAGGAGCGGLPACQPRPRGDLNMT
jgi:hypothetical protein